MIKSLEEKNNNKISVAKAVFLSIIFILPIIFSFKVKRVNAPDVLGEKSSRKKSFNLETIKENINAKINKSFEEVKEKSQETLKEVGEVISETASKSAQNLTNFVFDQAISNILKEVEKLPKDQQEKIKEKICK